MIRSDGLNISQEQALTESYDVISQAIKIIDSSLSGKHYLESVFSGAVVSGTEYLMECNQGTSWKIIELTLIVDDPAKTTITDKIDIYRDTVIRRNKIGELYSSAPWQTFQHSDTESDLDILFIPNFSDTINLICKYKYSGERYYE